MKKRFTLHPGEVTQPMMLTIENTELISPQNKREMDGPLTIPLTSTMRTPKKTGGIISSRIKIT